MFTSFFMHLRNGGLPVSPVEWMTLMDALEKGLAQNSLKSFYWVSRSILCRSEKDYDRFEELFLSYFKALDTYGDLPDYIHAWLKDPKFQKDQEELEKLRIMEPETRGELERRLRRTLGEQTEAHNEGDRWIGAGGTAPIGHSGDAKTGLRIDGSSRNHRAIGFCGTRKFQDFRDNTVLTSRQFQLTFRKLRQMSEISGQARTELDVEETVRKTSDQAGVLKLAYRRPRKNQICLLLLMDCGGTMKSHSRLCNQLFQAVKKANHWKALDVYYFHNCIYDELFTTPECLYEQSIPTDRILSSHGPEYRVIVVGDGIMGPEELFDVGGNYFGRYNETAGIEWLYRFQRRYKKMVWLNPALRPNIGSGFLAETLHFLKQEFPTYPLTLQGLEDAMKHLLTGM